MTRKSCRFIIVLVIFFCSVFTNSFANETDSLKKLLTTKIADTTRVNVLNALSKSLFSLNPDSSVAVATTAKTLAERINYKTGLALAYKNMGIGYYYQGNYKEAILSWQQAIEVYKGIGDKKGIANMLNNQGAIYFNQGDDAKS